jgi:hypothetical protein
VDLREAGVGKGGAALVARQMAVTFEYLALVLRKNTLP